MADYIEDSGSSGYDALLGGTYTTQASNHALTLGADGEANTGFTLPTGSSWVLVETFNVEGVAGDIGYTKWFSDTSDVLVDITAIQDIVDADTQITNYDIVATHYDHTATAGERADVYRGDEATTLALAGVDTGIDFTFPSSTWKITDTVLATDTPSQSIHAAIPVFGVSGDATQNTVGNILTITDNVDGTGYGYSRLSDTSPAFLTENPANTTEFTFTFRFRSSSVGAQIILSGWAGGDLVTINAADTWQDHSWTAAIATGVAENYLKLNPEGSYGTIDLDMSYTSVTAN